MGEPWPVKKELCEEGEAATWHLYELSVRGEGGEGRWCGAGEGERCAGTLRLHTCRVLEPGDEPTPGALHRCACAHALMGLASAESCMTVACEGKKRGEGGGRGQGKRRGPFQSAEAQGSEFMGLASAGSCMAMAPDGKGEMPNGQGTGQFATRRSWTVSS